MCRGVKSEKLWEVQKQSVKSFKELYNSEVFVTAFCSERDGLLVQLHTLMLENIRGIDHIFCRQ